MARKRFFRQNVHGYKRLKPKWRRPTGMQSKMRESNAGHPAMPHIGFGSPKAWRGLHPSGAAEFFVRNLHDLGKVDAKTQAVRISAAVGRKKREEIVKRAKEMNLRVLNP